MRFLRHPFYLAYASMLLGGASYLEYRGWSLADIDEVKNVPRTVRDNPGAYRSHYRNYSRYLGGK
ncbi:MAG: hypothetical protein K2X35_04310 [Bryobacteraceae bacterium]|jgi:hypothetical protein|nr:hypothetical protein [Bryobacteraceae bacterium]